MFEHSVFTRRSFLAKISIAAVALQARELLAQTIPPPVPLNTPSGQINGLLLNGVRAYRGIPFAQSPVGQLRFKPPVKITPWAGVLDASKFKSAPMQSGNGRNPRLSEDCLYLNVWAPQGSGPFPAFVWIHGGGFTGGYAFDPTTNGTQFASEGVIVVTIAYRLGVFGFLDFGELLGEEYSGSANNALKDLIAALEWIRDNIEAFGGDPDRVTVGGESAGAKLTDILMGVPSARSLFHQTISESGGAERVATRSGALAVASGFADDWNRKPDSTTQSLLTADPTAIIEVQNQFMNRWPQHFPLRCELDGSLLPRLPIETINTGNTRGKRLLIGTNREESALFDGPADIRDVTASDLGNLPLQNFEQVFVKYNSLFPSMTPKQLRIRALTAEEYWIPSVRVADANDHGGGQTWMYRLDFAETGGGLKGYAYHSLEIGMVWGKPHLDVPNAADEVSLGKQVHSAWLSFIHGDVPKADGLPTWPQYQKNSRATLTLNTQSAVENNPQEAERKLWDGLL